MDCEFFKLNRQHITSALEDGDILVIFSGRYMRKRADENHMFFADRTFYYMTGIDTDPGIVYTAMRRAGRVFEKLFLLPHDLITERWYGQRITDEEAREKSGIEDIGYMESFEGWVNRNLGDCIWLDLETGRPDYDPTWAMQYAGDIAKKRPWVRIRSIRPAVAAERTVKKPCEIEAMRVAEDITRDGILSMMHHVEDGMPEYVLKAHYDMALAKRGCLEPGFPSIISAGANNFCIHYYSYRGVARNGDLVLNDVGAQYLGLGCDVSRAFPVNGKFSDRQKLLFECAYKTSEHMFGLIRPGYPMAEVDAEIRRYNARNLVDIGLMKNVDEVATYMWHGGAHHVGFDTHDITSPKKLVEPGYVFCIDVGIYVEKWGIGFRLEDNCLVTETGCENLSRAIPRTVEDIEAEMARKVW